ncbi:hypothetical protein LLG96_09050, partial [bacterium]|nr:hypothetical protein [bacterium]
MKIICCVFAVFLFVFASVFADFLTDASLPFTRIDPGIVIEKYPIATPVKNGPLKILFFGSRDTVGQAVSGIAARLECRFEAVLTESRTQIGARPYMSTDEADILSENAILERAVTLLRERWDVIWLDFGLDDLPERVRLAMLNNVDRGAGLVCVGNSRQLKKYASGRKGDTRQLEAAVFAKFKPVCAGKRGIGLLVAMPQPYLRGSARDVADYHTSAVNAVMVASGKNTGIVVTKVPKPARIYPLDGLTGKYYRVYLYNNGDKRDIKFHMRYRNDSGHLTAELMNSYIVEHGRSYVKITFPYVPIGVYSVDISLFDSGGVTAIAGTSFAVTSRMFISEIDCWERIAREGGDINGVVRLSQGLQKGMKLELELVDGWGRLIGQQVFSSDNDLNNDGLEFTLRHHKERSLTARARLYRDGELVHELEKPVFTMKEFDARKYSLIVTDDLASEVSSRERYKVLGRAGVTGIDIDLTGIDSTRNAVRIAQNAAGSGLRIIPRIARIENTENKPVMNPVITTVDFNEKLDKRVRAFADTLKHLSPFAFSIGGTNMLTPYEVDVGFSTNDVESFQRYLESKYKSIDTLNHAWRTNYTSFREAQPVTFDDARLTDNYPAWLDTRLHMEAVFTLVHNVATESVYHVKSDAKVGIESFDDVWSPFRGFNLYELTGIVSLAVTPQDEGYGLPGDCSVSAAVASFAIPGSITGLSVNGDASSRGS